MKRGLTMSAKRIKTRRNWRFEDAQRPSAQGVGESGATKTVAPQGFFHGQKAKKKQRKVEVLEQWAEVTISDGVAKTVLFPSNEKLIEHGQTMDPPPELVYRRIHFVDGVPPMYYYITEREDRRKNGGLAIQRMTVETWLAVVEKEKARGDGHLMGVPFLPRPEERGICDCDVCTRFRETGSVAVG
jgi:hypothetical protein